MTRSFRFVRPVSVVAGAAVASLGALAGCGGNDDRARAKREAPRPAATLPAELQGSWTRRFGRREVELEGSPAGRYTLMIGDGIAQVYEGPEADPARECLTQEWCFEVTLEGSGRILTVGETQICPGTGRYSFTVKGDTLTTRKIADDCQNGRPVLFDGRTWRRAP